MLTAYILNNAVTQDIQTQILKTIFFASVIMLTIVTIFFGIKKNLIKPILSSLKFLSILFLLPLLFDKDIWRIYPFVMITITFLLAFWMYHSLKNSSYTFLKQIPSVPKTISYIILTLLITGYTCFFSYYTILNHYLLGTSTYDFGFVLNSLVNTLHGHFMAVSYIDNKIFFRDHCDFIILCYLPFFYLFPKAETLFILQSLTIGLAALPLFLFSQKVLNSTFASLLIVFIFLMHPANHSAIFYDVHSISFLPLFFFSLFYFLEKKSFLPFLLSIFLILSVKADMFVVLFSISIFFLLSNKNDFKFYASCFAASLFYAILYALFIRKWLVHPFFFYFNSIMIDKNGGIIEILKSIAVNPFYFLNSFLTEKRILYICQMFGPLIFLPLIRKKNYPLFIYGLILVSLGGESFSKIGFQYVWYLLPPIFIGFVYFLKDLQIASNASLSSPATQKNVLWPILLPVFFVSMIFSWQYGAILKNKYCSGGFHEISFKFTQEDKQRLDLLDTLIAHIPGDAFISASEGLTSHFLNHPHMLRLNELKTRPDYLLILVPNIENADYVSFLINSREYKPVYKGGGFELLEKNPSSLRLNGNLILIEFSLKNIFSSNKSNLVKLQNHMDHFGNFCLNNEQVFLDAIENSGEITFLIPSSKAFDGSLSLNFTSSFDYGKINISLNNELLTSQPIDLYTSFVDVKSVFYKNVHFRNGDNLLKIEVIEKNDYSKGWKFGIDSAGIIPQ